MDGSRLGESLADSMPKPVIVVAPACGVTAKPVGPVAPSKFRYFAVVPSMAFLTPSEAGLLAEEAAIGSLGWRTFTGALTPRIWTSAICMLFCPGPAHWTAVHR